MEAKSQYFEQNKDFQKFINFTSDHTGNVFGDVWADNIKRNHALFLKTGWATTNLQAAETGKTSIIIGASPALEKQLDTLREIQHDPQFVLCGLSCNLGYLLNNGIQPKYCITVDADSSQGVFWKDLDMEKTKNITLLASTLALSPHA